MGDVINIITTANVSSNLAKKRRRIYTTKKKHFQKIKELKSIVIIIILLSSRTEYANVQAILYHLRTSRSGWCSLS